MLEWAARWRRRRRIRRVARRLGASLKQRYGVKDAYTAGQLRMTMEKARIAPDAGMPAAAMFAAAPVFFALYPFVSPEEHEALRCDVADLFFEGDAGFSCREAVGAFGVAGQWGGDSSLSSDSGGASFGEGSGGDGGGI